MGFFSVSFIYKRFVAKIKSLITKILFGGFGKNKKDKSKKKEKNKKESNGESRITGFSKGLGFGKKDEVGIAAEKGLSGTKGYEAMNDAASDTTSVKKKKRNPFKRMF
ncbi:hypothetical protein TWF694_006684 [Orbilia ellipsospora]|uniref:Uncharacterized protein n=1 Tax=Orbilia ellipsospora TaxID=2528407 RepID=A0AAV9XL90_9PEZI